MSALHDVLATAPLFSSFVESDLVALASAMRARKLSDGDVLFRQGQKGDAMVLCVGGVLAIEAEDESGHSIEIARLGIGDIVGEMSALDPAPRSATVKAIGSAEVYELDRSMLGALMINARSLYAALLRGLGNTVTDRLRRTNKSIRTEAFSNIALLDAPSRAPDEASGRRFEGSLDVSDLDALSHFTPDERRDLLEAASLVAFEDQEALCAEGRPGHTCFIIASGSVEVIRHAGDQEHRLATLGVGTIVGQLALLHDAPRSATLQAKGPVVVVAIGRGAFARLLRTQSSLGLKLHEQVIVSGIRQLRVASRMLSELRAAQDQTDTLGEVKAITPEMVRKASQESSRRSSDASTPYSSGSAGDARAPRSSRQSSAERAKVTRQTWQAVDGGTPRSGDRPPKLDKTPTPEIALYVTTALNEWGLKLTDLDDIQFSVPVGQITAAELKARKG